ncbi:unnamed protein product, partial [Meganyctiphanes norvegica]
DLIFFLIRSSRTPHKNISSIKKKRGTSRTLMGIGHLNEEGLEACHKLIRRFRATWTLQSSDNANIKDLIKKLWLVSDPYFYSFRRTIKCSKCGSTGHQRNCPFVVNISKQSESDVMVEEMFLN